MRWKAWSVVAGLALLGVACGHGSTKGEAEAPEPEASPVRISVTNDFNGAVEVIAVYNGTNYRVGLVGPGMTSEFRLQQAAMKNGPVEFLAQPENGGQPFRSGRLILAPGEVVDIHVALHLLNSTATIRP